MRSRKSALLRRGVTIRAAAIPIIGSETALTRRDAMRGDDVVRLSPPGFVAPLPDGFPATYLAYCDWLEMP
jgi:hypothetical protein